MEVVEGDEMEFDQGESSGSEDWEAPHGKNKGKRATKGAST
jgi:hypothetical protein